MSGSRVKALRRQFRLQHGRPVRRTQWVNRTWRRGWLGDFHPSELRSLKKAYNRRRRVVGYRVVHRLFRKST